MIFTSLLLLTLFLQARAQDPVFSRGTVSFAAGYGFGSVWHLTRDFSFSGDSPDGISLVRATDFRVMGPVYAKFELGVGRHAGIGLSYAWSSNSWTDRCYIPVEGFEPLDLPRRNERISHCIMFRFNAHFGPFKRFDPYVGAGIGYKEVWVKSTVDGYPYMTRYRNQYATLGWELDAGLRFYATRWLAPYVEVGLSKSIIQTGIVFTIPVNQAKQQARTENRRQQREQVNERIRSKMPSSPFPFSK
jgi:opacity protein-like surface antigen